MGLSLIQHDRELNHYLPDDGKYSGNCLQRVTDHASMSTQAYGREPNS